jgi:hypothetical protein
VRAMATTTSTTITIVDVTVLASQP